MITAARALAIGSMGLGLTLIVISVRAQDGAEPLVEGFNNPHVSARPRTWWHWTGGNVTREGITKDLEWMKRIGLAGFQLADVAFPGAQTVEKKVLYGTSEWYDAVRHATQEAQRLDLEMGIFSSPGWSLTGGPWVKPEQAMKKLVWSETNVTGPMLLAAKLLMPPINNGPIRNLARGGRTGQSSDPTFYADAVVIAFKTPPDESKIPSSTIKASSSSGPIDPTPLLDDDLNSSVTIKPSTNGGLAWVQYEFDQPHTVRAITLAGPDRGIPTGRALVSWDGSTFRTLFGLPSAQQFRAGTVRAFAFEPVTAKVWRIEITGSPIDPAGVMAQTPPKPAPQYALSEFILHAGGRVHRAKEKAGFSFLYEYEHLPTPAVPATVAVSTSSVVVLTEKMAPAGTLQWDVPPGNWTIMRFGYSLTGAKNRPAPPSGSGYEVDKLSKKHLEAYFRGYFGPLEQALGPMFATTLRCVVMDSWEAGMQNWTDEMLAEFSARRGYDPTPYLPALVGRIVGSAEISDRFLWDFRRTLAEMFAEHHHGAISKQLSRKGLELYAEAAGVSMEIPEDTLLNKSKITVPMCDFGWAKCTRKSCTTLMCAGPLHLRMRTASESWLRRRSPAAAMRHRSL